MNISARETFLDNIADTVSEFGTETFFNILLCGILFYKILIFHLSKEDKFLKFHQDIM